MGCDLDCTPTRTSAKRLTSGCVSSSRLGRYAQRALRTFMMTSSEEPLAALLSVVDSMNDMPC